MAATADGDRGLVMAQLLRVIDSLVAPHYLLTRLGELTELVLAGNAHAADELRSRVIEMMRQVPAASQATESVVERFQEKSFSDSTIDRGEGTIDFTTLIRLTYAVVRVFEHAPAADRRAAVVSVIGLAIMARSADRLLDALRGYGPDGVAREMTWIGSLRAASTGAPPPMHVMSGGGPAGIPGLPGGGLPGGGLPGGGLPGGGFPGGPGHPGGGHPTGPIGPDDDLLGFISGHLKDLVTKKKLWDPEDMDHAPIGVFTPPFIDEKKLECEVQLVMALKDRNAPPPPRPARVVWSDNITRIDAPNPCAGSRVVIRGRGFGSPKPAGVTLMIPINGACTPFDVKPADWTNTAITITLPANVTSGPIGFADLAYVTAYNAWVDRMNKDAADAVAAAKCSKHYVPDLAILSPFSECPPATAFNHLRAGSAIIKSFTVNLQTLAVAEPTDVLTLAWEFVNAESSRIDRISANGPPLSGSTTLNNPPGLSSLVLGPAAHTTSSRFTYRLTAIGPCGTVSADVTVIGTKQPGLTISQIEVTQGIQTIPPTVKMVSQKPTVVRVRVNHSLGGWGTDTVPKVVGRMKAQILGNPWSPWFDAVNGSNPIGPIPGASITVPSNPLRTNTNDTLNFLIPPAYCTGDVIVLVEVRVVGFDARPDFAGFSETIIGGTKPGQLTFESRHILNLRYVRVNWSGVTPSDAVCQASLQSALPLLPAPLAVIQPLANTGIIQGNASDNARRDTLLDDFYDQHNCSAWEMATEFLGSDCPDEDDEIWVLIPGVFFVGKARDIPGNVCFMPPNDGPYAGHELAHCLNQIHLGVACPTTGQTAPGGDNPSTWPNNGILSDVPFDVSINSTVPGGGTTVWDMMTYCGTPTTGGNNTWPSPRRWQQLWDYNGP
jgi:hypothetical protein